MLSNYSTEELEKELARRQDNPAWFFRAYVAEDMPMDDDFFAATAWMDEPQKREEQ